MDMMNIWKKPESLSDYTEQGHTIDLMAQDRHYMKGE